MTRIRLMNLLDETACVAAPAQVIAAVQSQHDEDFRPFWSTTVALELVERTTALSFLARDGARRPVCEGYALFLVAESRQAQWLQRYLVDCGVTHAAVICMETCDQWGESWSVLLSRLVLNLAAQDGASHWLQGRHPEQPEQPVLFYFDVTAPVTPLSYGYDGIALADFVLPTWFDAGASRRTHFLGGPRLAPFTVCAGGSCWYFDEAERDLRQFLGEGPAAVRAANRFLAYDRIGAVRRPVPPHAQPVLRPVRVQPRKLVS